MAACNLQALKAAYQFQSRSQTWLPPLRLGSMDQRYPNVNQALNLKLPFSLHLTRTGNTLDLLLGTTVYVQQSRFCVWTELDQHGPILPFF